MGAKKGEKLHGRVEEGAVAESGPGMGTMDQNADGVGLTTPASSPMAGRQVNEKTADTINPNTTSTRPTEPVDRSPGPAVKPGPPDTIRNPRCTIGRCRAKTHRAVRSRKWP